MTDTAYLTPDLVRLDGVRRKRMLAFLVDAFIVSMLTLGCYVLLGILGFVTFGVAWLFLFLVSGSVFAIIAVLYTGMSFGGPASATMGMRMAGLVVRSDHGGTPGFIQGAAHVVLFYVTTIMLTPLVLIVSLFAPRKRLIHDMLCGVTVENAAPPYTV